MNINNLHVTKNTLQINDLSDDEMELYLDGITDQAVGLFESWSQSRQLNYWSLLNQLGHDVSRHLFDAE